MEKYKQGQSIVGYSSNRTENDFYPTPPAVTRDILKMETFDGNIWEPACGDGAMSVELIRAGYSVYSSDLINRNYGISPVDFLLENKKVDNIVTNPPFRLINQFAYHALKCASKKVVFLAKLAFLETVERKALFETTPLARVYVYSHRVSFCGGSGMIAFAWFVWEHGYADEPVIRWI